MRLRPRGRIAVRVRRSVIGSREPDSSPRRRHNRREYRVSTARFSVPLEAFSGRDLGSIELWERSLTRSRQRRRLTEVGRRARRRRKSASLAAGAALVAAPVVPRITATAAAASGARSSASIDAQSGDQLRAVVSRVLLRVGSEGSLVAAAQRRLNEVLPLAYLAVDGIYGPLTRAAVLDFQRRYGLPTTGSVDPRMWAVLFDAPVLAIAPSNGEARATTPSPGGNPGHQLAVSGTSSPGRSDTVPAGAGSSGRGSHDARSGGTTTPAAFHPVAIATPKVASRSAAQPVAVVAPSAPSTQQSTYVLTDGVALPLPRSYLVNGYVDQGVDYAAPGGSPSTAACPTNCPSGSSSTASATPPRCRPPGSPNAARTR